MAQYCQSSKRYRRAPAALSSCSTCIIVDGLRQVQVQGCMLHVEVLSVVISPQATSAKAHYIQCKAKQVALKLQAHLGSCLWPSLPCSSQCLGCLLPQLMASCQQWHPAAAMQEQVTHGRTTQPNPAADHNVANRCCRLEPVARRASPALHCEAAAQSTGQEPHLQFRHMEDHTTAS